MELVLFFLLFLLVGGMNLGKVRASVLLKWMLSGWVHEIACEIILSPMSLFLSNVVSAAIISRNVLLIGDGTIIYYTDAIRCQTRAIIARISVIWSQARNRALNQRNPVSIGAILKKISAILGQARLIIARISAIPHETLMQTKLNTSILAINNETI